MLTIEVVFWCVLSFAAGAVALKAVQYLNRTDERLVKGNPQPLGAIRDVLDPAKWKEQTHWTLGRSTLKPKRKYATNTLGRVCKQCGARWHRVKNGRVVKASKVFCKAACCQKWHRLQREKKAL